MGESGAAARRAAGGGTAVYVLAAGASSRLHPLTASRPKPMVPVAGRPVLQWCLEAVREAGFGEATLVVGHRASTIQSHFQDGRSLGMRVRYAQQPQQIGTAHAVATALRETGVPDAAVVLDGDNVFDAGLVRALAAAGGDALGVTKSRTPGRYGVVTLEGGAVRGVQEKPALRDEALVSTGSYVFSRRSLDRLLELVEQGVTDLPGVINALLAEGARFRPVSSTGAWLDAVEPFDLVPLTELLLQRAPPERVADAAVASDAVLDGLVHVGVGTSVASRAIVLGPASLGANVRVGPGAIVSRSLVLDDVKIGPGAIVEGSVVAEGATVGAGAVLGSGPVLAEPTDAAPAGTHLGAIVGEGTVVGPGAVLAPGTVLGVGVTVAPGVVVRGRIPDRGWVV